MSAPPLRNVRSVAVIHWDLGIAAKSVLVPVASVGATRCVYHSLVPRFPLARCRGGVQPLLRSRRRTALLSRAAVALIVAAATALAARTADAATPVGRWYAEGGAAQVEISPCGEGLCGRVVWLRAPFDEDGCDWRDRRNPDSSLRNRPLVGLEILAGLRPSDDAGSWTGGTVYDPTSGRTYRCTMALEGDDRLRLRGYIGMPLLGRTTTWIRVGTENEKCNSTGDASRAAVPERRTDNSSPPPRRERATGVERRRQRGKRGGTSRSRHTRKPRRRELAPSAMIGQAVNAAAS